MNTLNTKPVLYSKQVITIADVINHRDMVDYIRMVMGIFFPNMNESNTLINFILIHQEFRNIVVGKTECVNIHIQDGINKTGTKIQVTKDDEGIIFKMYCPYTYNNRFSKKECVSYTIEHKDIIKMNIIISDILE
jgi:hypothetical protein